jgi:hypothetical protein
VSTDGVREDGLVVKDTLGPVHKRINIFGSGKLRGAFVAHAVFPQVFVSGSIKKKEVLNIIVTTTRGAVVLIISPRARGHDRALRRRALSI